MTTAKSRCGRHGCLPIYFAIGWYRAGTHLCSKDVMTQCNAWTAFLESGILFWGLTWFSTHALPLPADLTSLHLQAAFRSTAQQSSGRRAMLLLMQRIHAAADVRAKAGRRGAAPASHQHGATKGGQRHRQQLGGCGCWPEANRESRGAPLESGRPRDTG